MEALIAILREVRDPRDLNARHDCCAMLFISLMATLCGAKSVVDIADFAEANESDLREIVDLPHGAPSHDCFSRLFRLLDPDALSRSFAAFARALREGLDLGAPKGVAAIDGKRLRRGYERGRAHMPPLMVSVWDAETRVSIAAPADAPNFPDLAALGRIESERRRVDGELETFTHYVALSKRLSPKKMAETIRSYWGVENNLHWPLDVVFDEDDARTRKDHAPQNLAIFRRMALDTLRAHPDKRSIARKMKLAAWKKEFFFELFIHMR